jgi:DNA-directed RNA polymerase II subunit RPB4
MEDLAGKLGPEFASANALSIPEVVIVLQYFKDQGKAAGQNSIFEKIYNYSKRFNKFPDGQIAGEVRTLLVESGFTQTEITLLINLCPETVQEAKALIPELMRFKEDEEPFLGHILEEIARLKNSQ